MVDNGLYGTKPRKNRRSPRLRRGFGPKFPEQNDFIENLPEKHNVEIHLRSQANFR